jgi:hypothetical protein
MIATGGILAYGPVAYAKLATNPKYAHLLIAGMKMKPGSSEIVPLAVRTVNALRKIEAEEMTIREKIAKHKRFLSQQQQRAINRKKYGMRPIGGHHF